MLCMFFSLTMVLSCFDQTASTVYYIYTHSDACHSESETCLTLSQFAANRIDSLNTTLILFSGNHSLDVDLSISSLDHFSMYSNTSTALINCGGSSHIMFPSTQNINIRNVIFVGCTCHITDSIGGLVLSNSRFDGQDTRRTALVLINVVKVKIDNSTFAFNKVRTDGGAIIASYSNMNISQSNFQDNSARYGGAIFAENHSNITIAKTSFVGNYGHSSGGALCLVDSSTTINEANFINNSAAILGGAVAAAFHTINFISIYTLSACYLAQTTTLSSSTIRISACRFLYNSAHFGGALYFYVSRVRVKDCRFSNNSATYGGVEGGRGATIHFDESIFSSNSAIQWGGVMDNKDCSNVTITHCHFEKNNVLIEQGGVVRAVRDTVTIVNSTFLSNAALNGGGGAVSGLHSKFTIISSKFLNNSAAGKGGALNTEGENTELNILDSFSFLNGQRESGTSFINNSAKDDGPGAAVYSSARKLIINGSLLVSNNLATNGNYAFYIALTTGRIFGTLIFSNNLGSLALVSSDIVIAANVEFANCSSRGAVTLLQSTVHFNGSYRLEHNHGENGGAIYAVESKLYVNAKMTVVNNTATENGGGLYLYQSEVYCQQNCHLTLQGNEATEKGGGIHLVSSFIVLNAPQLSMQAKWLELTRNTAKEGGGLFLEANSKLYIVQYSPSFHRDRSSDYSISFTSNSAEYGGAVYVDDYTNSIGTCTGTSSYTQSPRTECFFQVLSRHLIYDSHLYTSHIEFLNNIAVKSGSILFGGLLDRCTRSQFAEINYKMSSDGIINGLLYFEDASSVTNRDLVSISSQPVKVCPCMNSQHDCTYQQRLKVRKGERFTVLLAAIDQVGHPVNATISGYLGSTESTLTEGQVTRITDSCARVTLRVFSLHDSEQLTLYASDGPCRDATPSTTKVDIQFLPCNSCPIGFQPSETSCTCRCHDSIKQYIECNLMTESFVRLSNVWISYINETDLIGYLVYSHCPLDYCIQSDVPVNLNQPNGADAQCAFNRTGLLCGSCQSDLSLSLSSSQCLSCPDYWPALFLSITIAAIIAGIVLVVILLALNLTVAVGTLNGLIFYANIVAANRSILLPFQTSNFITIFISWLNLELGMETCYFPEMDAYTKTWLQLVFPVYVISLVILVIIISHYSFRFSRLIGKKNPVATLAMLILLSYSKLLQTIIAALSFGIVEYPNGSNVLVWLPDATVNYITGKHIVLFIVALIILLVGLVYTFLLFSWQWLFFKSCPKWRIFAWMRNPKSHIFMETYTAPYTPRHRYWTGLLLLVRNILCLIAAVNVLGEPEIALASVSFTVGFILVVKSFIGRVYKKWPVDLLEVFFYFNILSFAMLTWLALSVKIDQKAIAYVSITTSFVLLVMIILYHMYAHTKMFQKFQNCSYLPILTKINQKPRAQSPPPDDDIHGVWSLAGKIDDPVNANNCELRGIVAVPSYSEVDGPTAADRV